MLAARVAQAGGHPGPFRAAGVGGEQAAAPITSCPLPGSLQAVTSARPGPLVPGQSRLGGSRICSYKSFLWVEAAAGPPGPPRPRRPGGWGGGGGSKNSSRSPGRGAGGPATGRRKRPPPPGGGEGEGEGEERTAAPVLLCPPPQPPLHIGVPAPPAGGWWLSSGPSRLIHSGARCYGPGRVAETAARRGTRPAPLGAAPAPGSRMCRCGWDPPPYTSGVPRPTPRDEAKAPAPGSRSSHGGAAPKSRPAAGAASLPPSRRLRLRLGLRLRRVQPPPPPAGKVRGGEEGGRGSRWPRLGPRFSAAATARGLGPPMLPRSHSLGGDRRSAGALLAVSLALCGALASLQREGREESGADR